MAQLLVTHPTEKHWYKPIANIKKYSEPDFEQRLYRYGKDIFSNYHVLKFKFDLTCDEIAGEKFKPDMLLVSKSLKKWIIIEVELCKTPTVHTKKQIICFSRPKFKVSELVKYVTAQSQELKDNEEEVTELFSNSVPDLLIIMDDYDDKVFNDFYAVRKDIKICVLEVYKRPDYDFETYRFGGDYPYELTRFSKIKYENEQLFRIIKKDILADLPPPDTEFDLLFNMVYIKASIWVSKGGIYFLRIPEHHFQQDLYLILGISIDGQVVLKKL
jgi:hypothetical protein